MFKSVFSRILSTFAVIILCCIVVLVFLVASGLFRDSQQRELGELQVAASEVEWFVKNLQSFTLQPAELLLSNESVCKDLQNIASLVKSDIIIVRSDGTVILSSDETIAENTVFLDSETFSAIVNDVVQNEGNQYAVSSLGGALPKKALNRFSIITDSRSRLFYLIIVTGNSSTNTDFALSITRRTAAAAIWIFFAALICASLVSRRITDPLKQISEASAQYAQGHFSARVKVEGKDEIAELGKAFNNMAGSLAAHEENRNTFLSNVSHDLRTPMTTISGFVDGMLDGTIPPDQYDRYLQIISGEVRRLSRLVNTLLEISRLESGRAMPMSEFNLTEKARQILISLMGKIEEKKIDVEFESGDDDVFVLANPDAIHQVLYNLLENAVKFTDENGKLSIFISPARNKKALVRIRNTGEGIPEEELSHVFERFYKSDRSRGLDKTGTGLGLYIVKTILEKHGETISVSSTVGEYTEFTFTLSLIPARKTRIADADFISEEPEKAAEATESLPDENERNQEQ